MSIPYQRRLYAGWLLLIVGFAILHAINLRADFPNHSPWSGDWAKYTDEGWYGNAAIRAHLFGNWYLPGDFNPAPAVPVWPFLEWLLFFFTGVTVQAARGLAVAFFFANLWLSYLLLRARGSRWMAMLALTLIVTSPFLYCFSRLAILEPMLIALTLGALNLAIRLPRMVRPVWASVWIGLIFTLMMLTKTTALFLLPALGWAILFPLWSQRKLALRCALTATGSFAMTFGLWISLVVMSGLLSDYKYLFFVNKYLKPPGFYWPFLSLWWSFHGGLWVDHVLVPLTGIVILGAVLAAFFWRPENAWARTLLLDPVVTVSVLAIAGYILFMTYQNHPQPRYYTVVAFFSFFLIAKGAEALLGRQEESANLSVRQSIRGGRRSIEAWMRLLGWSVIGVAGLAAVINGAWTIDYAAHPEYTFVDAAQRLTRYIDDHPNGKRLLLSISGDEITLITHMPTICDDFGTEDLPGKMAAYQPGWYATWNDFDPGTLEDIHNHFSLEQVVGFRAFDDPERNHLVLFKLHPLPNGETRDPGSQNLQIPLPDDKIEIPIQ